MKNRVLALFLAVLMLVAVFPLASVAAPVYEDDGLLPTAVNGFFASRPYIMEDGTSVAFKNNWTVGRLDLTTGNYELYDEVAEADADLMGVEEGKTVWHYGGDLVPNEDQHFRLA